MGPSTNDQGRRVSEQSSISVKKGEGKQKKHFLLSSNGTGSVLENVLPLSRYPNSWTYVQHYFIGRLVENKRTFHLLFWSLLIFRQFNAQVIFTLLIMFFPQYEWWQVCSMGERCCCYCTHLLFSDMLSITSDLDICPLSIIKRLFFSLLFCHYLSTRFSSWGYG